MKKWAAGLFVLVVCVSIAASGAVAQVSTSSVSGSVVDPKGLPIAGAKVIVKNEATGVENTTTTTSSGDYNVSSLVPGLYSVTVTFTGFRTFTSAHNVLTLGTPLVVDAKMEVGAITEVVQVEATYERIDTTGAMVSDLISRRAIRDLPLNGRNPLSLIVLEPGLVQRSGGQAGSGTHVNGSRDRAFNVTLDGIDINEPSVPNPQSNVFRLNTDNVQEYRVVTSNPTPEFGRNSGANIALASRNGTNDIHGTAYDYFRNNVLNANDWFNNLRGVPRPAMRMNQFGAEAGGPIIKNKTFWFASWQGQRMLYERPIAIAGGGTPITYTGTAKTGLFRYVSGTVNGLTRNSTALVDPRTGALLPGVTACSPPAVTTNCIATYDINAADQALGGPGLDTTMKAYFNPFPTPNDYTFGDGLNTGGFTWNPPSLQPEERVLGRVDHQFNANNSLFGRFVIAYADNKKGDFLNARPELFPGFPPLGEVYRRPMNLALSYRRVFSPQLVNEFTTGFARFTFDFAFGRANPAYPNIPAFSPSNVSNPYLNQSGTTRWLTTMQYIDNVSYTRGPHLFRGGINFRFVRHNDQRSFVGGVVNVPTVGFSSGTRDIPSGYNVPATCPSSGAATPLCINSNDIARLKNSINELLGFVASESQSYFATDLSNYTPSGLYIRGARQHQFDTYVQDEWRVKKNVTVNYGVRWEWNRPATEAHDRLLGPDGPIFGGTGVVTFVPKKTFWNRENANALAPRVGIAWDPFSNGKTVIRAGYGIAFDTISTFQMVPILGLVPGTSANCNLSISSSGVASITSNCPLPSPLVASPGTNAQRVASGFPLTLPQPSAPPSSFTSPAQQSRSTAPFAGAFDPNLQNPTVHEWSLTIQRDLGKDTVFQIGYIGKRGTHLFRAYDANQVLIHHDGFLTDFVNAQTNLTICQANATACKAAQATAGLSSANQTANSFANWGLTGQQNMPLWSTILGPNTSSPWRNSTAVTNLQFNAAGAQAQLFDSNWYTASGSGSTLIPGVIATGNPNFFRPNAQFSSIFYFDAGGDSYYHGLQLELRRQARSLTYGAAYTWSKSIDNMSVDPVGATSSGAVGNNSRSPTDIYNWNIDRGRSDFDRRHVFSGFFLWDLPFGRGQKFATDASKGANYLFGGWSVTILSTIMTGEPFSVISGRFTNGNIRNSRADVISGAVETGVFYGIPGILGPTVFPAFELPQVNASATPFRTPAPGTNGNGARNMFTGPSFWNMDLGVNKRFDITERFKLTLRADAFNLFNHPNFDNPLGSTDGSTSIASTSFGRTCCVNVFLPSQTNVISTGEANRVVQMALRLTF